MSLSDVRGVDDRRKSLLKDLAGLDPSVLSAKPIAGKWSILEIVEHLVLGERSVMGDLVRPRESRKRSLKNHALYPLAVFVLRFDIPVRVH